MKRAMVVGGANGIGLGIAVELSKRNDIERVYIVDKAQPAVRNLSDKIECYQFDLTQEDYSFFDRFNDVDTLMITAGFGRLSLFSNVDEQHIVSSFNVNTISVIRLIRRFYNEDRK